MDAFEQDANTEPTMLNKSVANTHEAGNCHQVNYTLHILYFSYRSIYNTHNKTFETTVSRTVNSIGPES